MGLFGSIKSAMAGDFNDVREGPAEFAALGAERLVRLRSELETGAIAPSDAWEQAGSERDYFVWELARTPGLPTEHFQRWHAQTPTDVTAALVGAGLVRDAWEIRTGAVAKDVDPNAVEPFFAKLAEAEEFLSAAVEEFPDAYLPWVPVITTARGLQADLDEIADRFELAKERKPYDFYACEQLLQGLAEKWSGDKRLAWGFARDVVENTAPRDPARAMLAHAAIEGASRGIDPKLSGAEYEELAHVFTLFVESTSSQANPEEIQALGAFVTAVAAREVKTAHVVQEAVARIRGRCGGYPWWMSDDELFSFDGTMNNRSRVAAQVLAKK